MQNADTNTLAVNEFLQAGEKFIHQVSWQTFLILTMHVSNTLSFSAIPHVVLWRFESIIDLLWISSTSTGRPGCWAFFNEKSPEWSQANQFYTIHIRQITFSVLVMHSSLFWNNALKYIWSMHLILSFLNWDAKTIEYIYLLNER